MGYEQSNTARLLFIHTSGIPIATAPDIGRASAQAFWHVPATFWSAGHN
jgi:hypothetical protein